MIRLLAAFAVAVALSLPLTEVPVIDDWAYYYSVDRLLEGQGFQILDYSCRFNLAQVSWGALFALPLGLSFAALRLSTLVLAMAGLVAFYDLLRRRFDDRSLALWTTALVAFNPLFFRLSLSFMTDVPLLALVAIAFWLFDLGLRAERVSLAAAGIAVVVLGYLVRELAIVAPVALLVAAAFSKPRRISLPLLAAVAVMAALGYAAELLWIRSVQGTTWGLSSRTEGLRHLFEVPPAAYLQALLHMLLTAAAFVSPLSLAARWTRRETAPLLGGAAVFALAALALDAVPFGAKEVLSPLGLGMSRALLPGDSSITLVGQILRGIVLVASSVSLAVILVEAGGFVVEWWRTRPALDTAWVLFGAGEAAALLVLWLWQDRYDLVLLLPALWLAALRAWTRGWSRPAVAAAVCAFALLGVLGTRDDFELNRAAWNAEAWLRQQGVAADQIDGGYVLNGWRLYAYADDFAPGFPAEQVPYLFTKQELPYVVSAAPMAGEALREYAWPRTWLSPSSLQVVHR